MLLAAVLLAGCNQGTGHQQRSPSAARIVEPSSSACVAAQSQPATPDGVKTSQPVWVLASGLTEPDDLWFDRDGSVLVGEYSPGRIVRVGGQAGLERLPYNVGLPEGITRIGDVLYVADQRADRVLAIDAAGNVRTFLQLQPVPGLLGLDQIVAQGDTLIVPDSPRGVILFVNTGGQVVRRAGGFARPAGAWPAADGSVLVADENLNGVFRLRADGTHEKLASLAVADDVVETRDGRIFAISESNGQMIEVGKGPFVTALKTAQGLALDGPGNLLVTEHDAGRLDLVLLTFKILPYANGVSLQPGQALCVRFARAFGFNDSVELAAGDGYRVLKQPQGDRPGEVLPDRCTQRCSIRVLARSGDRSDGAWVTYTNS